MEADRIEKCRPRKQRGRIVAAPPSERRNRIQRHNAQQVVARHRAAESTAGMPGARAEWHDTVPAAACEARSAGEGNAWAFAAQLRAGVAGTSLSARESELVWRRLRQTLHCLP